MMSVTAAWSCSAGVAAFDDQRALLRPDVHIQFDVGDARLRQHGVLLVLAFVAGFFFFLVVGRFVAVGHVLVVEQHGAGAGEDQHAHGDGGQHRHGQRMARQLQALAPAVVGAARPEQQRQHDQQRRAAPVGFVPAFAQQVVAVAVHGRVNDGRRVAVHEHRVVQPDAAGRHADDVVDDHRKVGDVALVDHHLQAIASTAISA
jgi:hypothetical protein